MSVEQNISFLWETIRNPQQKTLMDALGIKITKFTKESIEATMPVDERTIQYYGMLHGGASVALAETLASVGAAAHIDLENEMVVGLEINANHLKSARTGVVTGVGKPVHVGKKTQVWAIEMKNDAGQLLCISRCTLAVIAKK